ncbi:hypothetical protein EXIGLDRAFT_725559 [Exidia glandulosa HHB12029]|uniref:Fungal pheromone STE3G-protein-coupled receptor n=1 Tax=Exidia glandulosa HHB12029 TaxID=1314781 RepID=A0A165DYW9_EXIGL|nr:hypothetical protein EXIGLDRAFT_725559 [Exidia glandulosa HHB12029]
MAAPDIVIPPLGRMYLEAIWMETLFYGFNCILFPVGVYILTTRKTTHGVLIATITVLFALATVHVGLSLAALHQAFASSDVLAVPHGPDLYFAAISKPLPVAKSLIYSTAVGIQDLLLIWRMYVVWDHRLVIVIVPLVLQAVQIASAYTATILLTRPHASLFGGALQAWGLTGWSLDITINTAVTLAIAGRLWWIERKVAPAYSRRRSYRSSIYTVIESGGIFALATLILFIMDVCQLEAAFVGVDPIMQLAVLTPLLLTVRVGLGITHGDHGTASIRPGHEWTHSARAPGGFSVDDRNESSTQFSIPLHERPAKGHRAGIEVKTDTFITA